jgi:hypothetical protein
MVFFLSDCSILLIWSLLRDCYLFSSPNSKIHYSLFIFAAANGVVIATEKKLPSILVDETSVCVNHP